MLLTHFVPGMTQLYWENSIYWTFIHILFYLWSQNLACFSVVLKRSSSLYDSQNMGFILTPCFSEFVGLWVWDALTSCSTYCTKDFEGGGECISSQTSRWHGLHTKGKQTQAVTDIYLLGLLLVVGGGTAGSSVTLPYKSPSLLWASGKAWASWERSWRLLELTHT